MLIAQGTCIVKVGDKSADTRATVMTEDSGVVTVLIEPTDPAGDDIEVTFVRASATAGPVLALANRS